MRLLNKVFLLAILIAAISCEDIVEEDISDENALTISPSNGQEVYSNAVNFQWNGIDGADDYRIQVFSDNQFMLLDSLVSQTSFIYPLDPGNYQWRVRGENSAYETEYTFPVSFSVFENTDLSNQIVFLSNPSSGIYINNGVMTFVWEELSAATSYDLRIVNVTTGQSVVYSENDINTNSFSIEADILNGINAAYEWQVRAKNATSQTAFSGRGFSLDSTVPNQPQNLTPGNNTSFTFPATVDFTWTVPTDSGVIQSPLSYVLEFSNDSVFSSVIQSVSTTTNSSQYVFTIAGDYYWRIKAIDGAGNSGLYSTPTKITIN
ncbi:MAG TPA: hypothetical protein VEW65_00140 [Chryseolinea sp.]|nr:hypothetical protein [Chryseolinea sp.]